MQKIVKRLKNNSVDNIQSDLLYKAAYLHDIGKANYDGDAHPYMSVVCMYDSFDCSGKKSRKYARRISHIIIAHKSDFCPPKDVAIEAAILRMADKIDKYNKSKYRLKKARKSYEKNLEKSGNTSATTVWTMNLSKSRPPVSMSVKKRKSDR